MPATPGQPPVSANCAAASIAMKNRSPSWSATWPWRRLFANFSPRSAACCSGGRADRAAAQTHPEPASPRTCAPGNPCLGVMLPYTPLHHLLMQALGGIPLVMTSGNRSDEPIAYDDEDAVDRLAGIADLFLVHDRPIHVRCDDSVTRIVDGEELPLRRSRGYAPQPIRLPMACPVPILAVGGQLKGTFALGRSQHAFVSHHLGDLDHFDAYRAFRQRHRPVRKAVRHQAAVARSRFAPRLCLDPIFALAEYRPRRGGRQIRDCWPCSIITPTWPAAWPSMACRGR